MSRQWKSEAWTADGLWIFWDLKAYYFHSFGAWFKLTFCSYKSVGDLFGGWGAQQEASAECEVYGDLLKILRKGTKNVDEEHPDQ